MSSYTHSIGDITHTNQELMRTYFTTDCTCFAASAEKATNDLGKLSNSRTWSFILLTTHLRFKISASKYVIKWNSFVIETRVFPKPHLIVCLILKHQQFDYQLLHLSSSYLSTDQNTQLKIIDSPFFVFQFRVVFILSFKIFYYISDKINLYENTFTLPFFFYSFNKNIG